jgi:hypothetical protein
MIFKKVVMFAYRNEVLFLASMILSQLQPLTKKEACYAFEACVCELLYLDGK